MTKNTNIGKCKLCSREADIFESHIIPKFATDWIKETSATGYLRQATHPDLRIQDGIKTKLLCAECEELFSRLEKRFAEDLFIPFLEKGQTSFEYDDWLLSFGVSLAWRTAMYITSLPVDTPPNLKPELARFLDKAINCWRAFLLEQRKDLGPYEHHLLFWSAVRNDQGLGPPDRFNMYLLRAIDAEIVNTSTEVFVYTKLPGLIFWSFVKPAHTQGLEGTRIYPRGIIATYQKVASLELGNFLKDRAKHADLRVSMSPKQRQKLANAFLKDPQHTRSSHSFEVLRYDISGSRNKRESK